MMKMYYTVPCTNGDVRLMECYIRSGRIEVCDNNSWGTICSNSWDDIDASVACNQLGYSLYGNQCVHCDSVLILYTVFLQSAGSGIWVQTMMLKLI